MIFTKLENEMKEVEESEVSEVQFELVKEEPKSLIAEHFKEKQVTQDQIDVAKEAFEKARDEFKARVEAFNVKLFEVKTSSYIEAKEMMRRLKEFLINITWKSSEAFFITETKKFLMDQEEKLQSGEIDKLYLKNREVDTFNYFLSKHEGKGLESAEQFLKIYLPIQKVLEVTNEEKAQLGEEEEKVKALDFEYNRLLHGIEDVVEKDALK